MNAAILNETFPTFRFRWRSCFGGPANFSKHEGEGGQVQGAGHLPAARHRDETAEVYIQVGALKIETVSRLTHP